MRVRRGIGSALAASALALLLALPARAQEPDPASASPEVDRNSGAYFYARYCASCHGRDGRGTQVGFPLVDRPSGPVTPELLLESLRTPLQLMPSFPRDVINDDVAALIAYHIATLEHGATGAATPSPPEVPAAARRPDPALPPPPVVAPADPRTYEIKEYDAGSCGAGHDLAVAPDGRVWYAGIERNTIVMFDPRGERFRCWPVPTRNGQPQGLRVDRDGLVWFTLPGLPDNKVAMFDPRTELFSEFLLPHRPRPFVYPHTLVFNAERDPVFSLAYGDGAGRIDRKTGHFDFFPVPTYRAFPNGIEVARNGHIWMAEFIANKLIEIDPRTGKALEYPHPRANEDPGVRRIAFDSRGNVWFSEHEFGGIGVFDPRTRRWRSWRAPANGGKAYGTYAVNVDRRDAIWFSHFGGNYIGRFDPRTDVFSVYPLPTPDANCRLMDFARDGTLWCMSSRVPKLVRLALKPGGPAAYSPALLAPIPHQP
jgi:virginiamycin B lyase